MVPKWKADHLQLPGHLSELPTPEEPLPNQYVPSDPASGDAVTKLTFNGAPGDSEDYDPSWSPLGGTVFYVRDDKVIHRKGVPGLNPDTSDAAIIGAGGILTTDEQVSPDGDSLAYVQLAAGRFHVFISPVMGSGARQLTSGTDANWHHPQWSTDGAFLTVTREDFVTLQQTLYTVRVRDISSPQRFYPPAGDASTDAAWPAVSTDRQVIVAGVGPTRSSPHTAHAFDGTQPSPSVAIENYPAYKTSSASPLLFPRLSPDGTRLAELAIDPNIPGAIYQQLWATRRNMNLPPQITTVGTQSIADSTAVVQISAKQGLATSVQIAASDPEADALTCHAYFLQDGMSFDSTTCTVSWTPSAPVGTVYHVLFQVTTGSGGSDAVIGEFTVTNPLTPGQASAARAAAGEVVSSNPTTGPLALRTPFVPNTTAELAVFDLAGRRVGLVHGRAGGLLVWSRETAEGGRAPAGVYLYRLSVGAYEKSGRVVLLP